MLLEGNGNAVLQCNTKSKLEKQYHFILTLGYETARNTCKKQYLSQDVIQSVGEALIEWIHLNYTVYARFN